MDRLVELSGDDKATVYALAGRGYIGIELADSDKDIAAMAVDIQSALDSIDDPKFRMFRKQELLRLYRYWKDGNEEWFDYLDALFRKRKDD